MDPEGARLLTVLYAYANRRTYGDGQRRLIHCKITTINIKPHQRNFYIFFCTIRSSVKLLICKVLAVYVVKINRKF